MGRLHEVGLTMIYGIGDKHARKLLDHFGNAEEIFNAKAKDLERLPGIGKPTARLIVQTDALERAEVELKKLEGYDHKLLFYTDLAYPARLRHCNDAPVLLYYRGSTDLNCRKVVSVVGTRNATSYGRMLCEHLGALFASRDVLVVSGLAHGIDVAMHQECVANGVRTVGVLGHGLDRVYPRANNAIAEKMLVEGGLLTEFRLGSSPDAENFPKRNRIIAGMADAVIVVEATRKGGALITAELANTYNRDVFAFPGRVSDPFSEGCNFLIKTNRAALIHSPKDLAYFMGWDEKPSPALPVQQALPLDLNEQESQVLMLLMANPMSVDALSMAMNLPQRKLAVTLLGLEMRGLLKCLPGNIYKLP